MVHSYIYILTIMALVFAVCISRRSTYVNTYKNKYFQMSAIADITILLSLVGRETAKVYHIYFLHIFTNMIVYGAAAFVPCFLVFMNRRFLNKNKNLILAPALIMLLLSIISVKTGWFYYIDSTNHYSRGKLFFMPMLTALFYFVMVARETMIEYREIDKAEKRYLYGIFAMIAIGVTVELLNSGIYAMWATAGIGMVLYYVCILELSGKYDILTGVRNRMAYETKKDSIQTSMDYLVIIYDINGLKPTNDKYGHEAGDKLIMQIANMLSNVLYGIGTVYRIGGDEFCAICERRDQRDGIEVSTTLQKMLDKANGKRNIGEVELSVSYGMEYHRINDETTFDTVFKKADEKMYQMKKEYYVEKGVVR